MKIAKTILFVLLTCASGAIAQTTPDAQPKTAQEISCQKNEVLVDDVCYPNYGISVPRSSIHWFLKPITNDKGKLSFNYFIWWLKLQFWKLVIPQ